jgi:hypothetical protein
MKSLKMGEENPLVKFEKPTQGTKDATTQKDRPTGLTPPQREGRTIERPLLAILMTVAVP